MNKIGVYSVIESDGEIRGADKFERIVKIGDGNVISELVTIERPANSVQKTIIGNNIIMALTHVGHNATIGDNCELS